MIIHRMSTQAPEPPVKFYKVIALSFLFLTVILLGVVVFITSKKVTITVLAKQDVESINLNLPVSADGSSDSLEGTVTTTAFSWSENFQPTGKKQVDGISGGTVTLYNNTAAVQRLVKTTRLLSDGGVLFRLLDPTTIPAHGIVSAKVYADQKGPASDIPASNFTIPGLSPDKQKVIYGKSTEAMQGGAGLVGTISDADVSNAKAAFDQDMQTAFQKTLPTSPGTGVAFLVKDENVKVDHAVGDEVSNFTVTGTSSVVVVSYDPEALKSAVDRSLRSKIDASSERFLSLSRGPTVNVATFDENNGTATINVRQEIAVTLDANSEKLAPENFFGKSKDELERYVLGLNHVAAADVRFSPAWVSSAPSSPDKISIIIKNVQ